MYRYGQPSRKPRSRQQQTLIFLLLLGLGIACVSLAIAYSGATRANANTREVLISRMQQEVTSATTRAYQLSQTGGSQSEAMVAIVRQHIYAARAINEITTGIYGPGNVLAAETLINDCVAILDQCDAKLQSGSVLTDTYTELRTAIDALLENVTSIQ